MVRDGGAKNFKNTKLITFAILIRIGFVSLSDADEFSCAKTFGKSIFYMRSHFSGASMHRFQNRHVLKTHCWPKI